MERLEPIGIRFTEKELGALTMAAKTDDRALSAFTRKIVVDYLRRKKFLK